MDMHVHAQRKKIGLLKMIAVPSVNIFKIQIYRRCISGQSSVLKFMGSRLITEASVKTILMYSAVPVGAPAH